MTVINTHSHFPIFECWIKRALTDWANAILLVKHLLIEHWSNIVFVLQALGSYLVWIFVSPPFGYGSAASSSNRCCIIPFLLGNYFGTVSLVPQFLFCGIFIWHNDLPTTSTKFYSTAYWPHTFQAGTTNVF